MKLGKSIILILGTVTFATSPVAADETKALAMEGGKLIKQLAGSLQAELSAAIKADGPASAVEICQLRAQEITFGVSDGSEDWAIARSSHRLRNPGNVADSYTASTIDAFLERAQNGEPAKSLVSAEIIEEDDQRVFKMVKAIPTVSVEVESVIQEFYPDDAARSFSVGDIRGVFTLSKTLK